MQIKFLCENQSSFSFPATDDIPCWSACKTKPLQTGVKMQLGFLQNKSCLKLSLFCMKTDDWLNFHVKFQSVHVNIISIAHHFFSFFSSFFFLPFFLLHISKPCQTTKNSLVKLKTNAYIHVMCTNTLKNNNIFYMLLTVSNLNDYWMSCETCVTCHAKHALQFTEHLKLRKCSNITLEYVHSIKN